MMDGRIIALRRLNSDAEMNAHTKTHVTGLLGGNEGQCVCSASGFVSRSRALPVVPFGCRTYLNSLKANLT